MTLTREEILALPPGRELDALVGKYVMGLDLVEDTMPEPKFYMPGSNRQWDVPNYSTDKVSAFVVRNKVQHIMELNIDLGSVDAVTTNHAICIAALLAVLNL